MLSFSSSLVRGLLSPRPLTFRTSKNGAGSHVENEEATAFLLFVCGISCCTRYETGVQEMVRCVTSV